MRPAGSQPAAEIHEAVVEALEEIDVDVSRRVPRALTRDDVEWADVVVTMGCGDACPVYPGTRYEDWAVGDPALASPEGVAAIRADIDARVRNLLTTTLGVP